ARRGRPLRRLAQLLELRSFLESPSIAAPGAPAEWPGDASMVEGPLPPPSLAIRPRGPARRRPALIREIAVAGLTKSDRRRQSPPSPGWERPARGGRIVSGRRGRRSARPA